VLQPILACGENRHRVAEIRMTLSPAKQPADAEGGAERALASKVASLFEVLLN
jgi:hypothetical protein